MPFSKSKFIAAPARDVLYNNGKIVYRYRTTKQCAMNIVGQKKLKSNFSIAMLRYQQRRLGGTGMKYDALHAHAGNV